eukprot:scaffold42983_cov176-Amphora_coffeaeformis.AAC.2
MFHILSDVLQSSAINHGSESCWILQSSVGDDRILTYDRAVECVDRHVDALHESISTLSASNHTITIVYLCNNSLDFALSILAASQISATHKKKHDRTACPALLNTRWSLSDMVAALQPAESILIVHGSEWQETAERLQEKLYERVETKQMPLPLFGKATLVPMSRLLNTTQKRNHAKTKFDPKLLTEQGVENLSLSDAVLVFTSGTTSTAKGVRLSHRALLVQAAAKIAPPCGYGPATKMLSTTVPFFHVGGLSSLLAVWMTRGTLVEPSRVSGSFSPSNVWESVARKTNPINTLVVVPAMVHALQQEENHRSRVISFPHVDLILVGGQSLSASQQTFLRSTFPEARIVQTFACTEAASSLTFLDATKPPELDITKVVEPPGVCVGSPPEHVQLQLFSSSQEGATKVSLINHPYQVGLIGTRGPHVMSGYWGKELRKQDGWYITSDFGYWDKLGRLHFCGRQTDTIRTGGETVWATEVEQTLQRHNDIAEVAVLGLPDELYGETVACAIVLNPNSKTNLTLKELKRWCSGEGLARYKQPRRLVILSTLPRNTSGKILKHRLKDSFAKVPHSRL